LPVRCVRIASMLVAMLIGSQIAAAQVPTVTVSGLEATSLLGAPVTFTLAFDNTAPGATDTGYGPFIDLILPVTGADGAGAGVDDGLSFVSATYLGQPVTATAFTFDASGHAAHPYAVDTSGAPITVTGTPGDQLVVLRLPFGSFTSEQPAAAVVVTANLSDQADAGFALPIRVRGGFQYGGDALANPPTDPSIVGAFPAVGVAPVVTPTILRLTKTYVGPEDETATGPNFPRQYRLTVDVATGQTVTDLELTDALPDSLQFVAVTSVSAVGAPPVTPVATPTTTTPGGTLTRRFSSVTGTSGTADATLEFSFYVPLRDVSSAEVIPPASGDDATSPNQAAAVGSWDPIDNRDAVAPVSVAGTGGAPEHTLTPKSLAIQKGVAIAVDTGVAGPSPGDTLEYTLDLQVSDFFALQDLAMTDVISDGQRHTGAAPQLSVVEHSGGNSASAPINGANFGFAVSGTTGETTATFQISQELLVRGLDVRLVGGCVPQGGTGGPVPDCALFNGGATTVRVTYRTVIQDTFDFPSPGDPSVDHGDVLGNAVTATADVLSVADATTPTGLDEEDTSGAGVTILVGTLTKSIYAINGITSFGTPRLGPGDTVTYRLQYTLPSSDMEPLTITDFLPLPVLFATEVTGPVQGVVSAAAPAAGQAKFGPADTFFAFSGVVPTISTDAGANSVRFSYPAFDDPTNQPRAIDLLFTVTASNQPFADGLFLTNQARSQEGSTNASDAIVDAIVQIQLNEPNLRIRKGAVTSSNVADVYSPVTVGPVAFTAPGSGGKRWVGTISSSGLAATPIDSNASALDAGDIVTFAIVVENLGSGPEGAFDVTFRDTLPAGFVVPADLAALNLSVTDGAGTALAFSDLGGGPFGSGGGLFGNGLQLVDPGASQGALRVFDNTAGTNIAVITYDLQLASSVTPNQAVTNTATLTNYGGTEGGPDFTSVDPTDPATVTTAAPSMTKVITATNQAHTVVSGGLENVAIGEIVTYTLTVRVPEGTTPAAVIADTLDAGLAFVAVDSITPSSVALTTSVGTFDDVRTAALISNPSSGATNDGRRLTLSFGTLTNGNTDNATSETVVIVYRAVVINSAGNNRGTQINNAASLTYTGGSTSVSAPNVRVVEPVLQVSKVAVPTGGDADDLITFTVTLSNPAATNAADAFDITFADPLPAGLTFVSAVHSGGVVPTAGPTASGSGFTAAFDRMNISQSSIFTVIGSINQGLGTGAVLTNTASAAWTSLPGAPGPQSTHNTLSYERTGNPADPGGASNDHVAQGSAAVTVSSAGVTKVVVSTDQNHTSGTNVAVGEILTYTVTVNVPEAVSSDVTLVDTLDPGLAFVGFDSLVVSDPAAVTTSAPGGFAGVLSGAAVSNPGGTVETAGSRVTFNFGNVTNTNTDSGVSETITLTYRAVVLNTAANVRGQARNNSAVWTAGGALITASAPNVTVVEPTLSVDKQIAPASRDAGDSVTVTLMVAHAGSSNADAFNVALRDALPAGLAYAGSLQNTAGVVPTSLSESGGVINATWATFPLGSTSTITFSATVAATATPGQVVSNTASTTHTSLPGAPGQLSSYNTVSYERTGNPADPGGAANTYAASDPATVTLFTNSIAGFVYVDRNDDGVFQPAGGGAEPPLAGVSVTLTGTDHLGTPVNLTTTTLANGSYLFANLRPGTYAVTETQPAGYADGRDTVGTLFGGTGGNDVIAAATIPTGGNAAGVSYNFGERETADVAVSKTDSVDPVSPGGTLIYTLTVTNNGPSVASNVRVADPLPAGTTFVSSTATGWSCTTPPVGSGGELSCTVPSLAVNAVSAIAITVTVSPMLVSEAVLTNVATVSTTTVDPRPDDNRDEEQTHVGAPDTADLSVTKVDAVDPVQAGQTITYTVVVTNNGPSGAAGVVLTDTLPATVGLISATPSQGAGCTGTTTITCDLGAVASGSAATVTVVGTTTVSGVVVNAASVTGTQTDPNPGNNHTSEPTTVGNPGDADLFVSKTDSTDPVLPGQVVGYTLSVGNLGPGTATGVVVTDTLPAGTGFETVSAPAGWVCPAPAAGVLTCTVGSLAVGPPVSIIVNMRIDAGTPSGTTVTNGAAVTSSTLDPNTANNTDVEPTTVLSPSDADLLVVKTDGTDPAVAGTNVSYALSVTNRGPATATSVTVTDTLPPGTVFVSGSAGCSAFGGTVACDAGTMAPGSSVALGITIATPPTPGVIDDLATVSGAQPDPIPGNNADPEQTTLLARADVAVVKSGPAIALAGALASYTVTVVNNGPSEALDVVVSDTTPVGLAFVSNSGDCATAFPCALGTLPPAATRVITVTYAVPASYTAPTPIANAATVTTTTIDPDPSNNTSTTTTPLVVVADVRLEKSGPATIVAGQTISYTIVVTNDGPSDSTAVVVSDPTPTGLVFVSNVGACASAFPCALGTLAPGATRTITAAYQVPPGYTTPNPVLNTASVSATTGDSKPTNNTATVATTLGSPLADLSILKSGPATVVPGDTVTFSMTVTNNGPSTATGVSVADPTPIGLTFVANTGDCATAFPCALGTMAPGQSKTIVSAYLVPATYQLPDPIVNSASVTATTSDPVLGNNTSTAETGVGADLVITKTASPSPAVAGAVLTYEIVGTNLGGRIAENVSITDAIPNPTTFLSATPSSGGTCGTPSDVALTGTLTCVWPGPTAVGAMRSITVEVLVDSGLTTAAPIVNVATTTNDVNDPNPDNNTATATTPVVQSADIVVTKTVDQPRPNYGDVVTFVVTVANAGPSDATGVSVIDAMPPGLELLGATPSQGSYDPATGIWTVGGLQVGAAARMVVTARVWTLDTRVNTATKITGDQPDPVTSNNTGGAAVTPNPVADVRVRKTVDSTAPNLGDTVTYTVVADNLGPNDATGVVVRDMLPSGLTLVSASPSRGGYDPATGTWTIGTVSVVPGPDAPPRLTLVARVDRTGPLVNLAQKVAANELDPVTPNNASGVTVNGQAADVQVVKTVDVSAPRVGQQVTFTVVATNNGPGAPDDVVLRDLLPAGLAFVSAAPSQGSFASDAGLWRVGHLDAAGPGATAILTIVATVMAPGGHVNTADVTGSSMPDTNPANDRSSSEVIADTRPIDLSLVINRTGDGCVAGSTVDFFISVTEVGPAETSGPTSVTLELPVGLSFVTGSDGWACAAQGRSVVCDTPDLQLATHVSATLRITATATGPVGDANWSYAAVFHGEDHNPLNDVDHMPVCGEPVVRPPIDPVDLSTVLSGLPAAASVGDTITVTSVVANNGPDPSPTTTVTAYVSRNARIVSAAPASGTCLGTGTVTCDVGPLALRAGVEVRWQVQVVTPGSLSLHVAALGTQYDPQLTNNSAVADIVVPPSPQPTDRDADGMPDAYEAMVGLNPAADDGALDADGDGVTNADEYAAGTHPRGRFTRRFAEGATGDFFDARFAILNPSTSTAASVVVQMQLEDGTTKSLVRMVPRQGRITVAAREVAGDATQAFATSVESDAFVAVDRLMTWDRRGYGSHAETGVAAAATRWYLAEGVTSPGINLFYLVQNPGAQAAAIAVDFLRPAPAGPVSQSYLVAPRSRLTIWVNMVPGLGTTDVSADIRSTNGVPIVVERAMYLDRPGEPLGAGHASAGVTDASTTWFLAEGATGEFFDEYVLIANPGDHAAEVDGTYLLPGGAALARRYTIAPRSRFTILVDQEDPQLASTAVSARFATANGVPVIVERAMWWPGAGPTPWYEAHASAGVTSAASRWAVAEGEAGGAAGASTYLLVANPSALAGRVNVTVSTEGGQVTTRAFDVAASSRLTIDVRHEFPEVAGTRFGAVVESVGPAFTPVVVEWAMYASPDGRTWAAGSGAVATPLP
jgi:uncharacterized repeat protein (TIGR01451 family)/fimbrial isopeptide formation D2 family protein